MDNRIKNLIFAAGLIFIFYFQVYAESAAQQKIEAERLIKKLQSLTQKPDSNEFKNTIDDLAAIGDPVISIMKKVGGFDNHTNIRVLRKIGTDKAKETLKEVAIVKGNKNSAWAASNFVELIQKKQEAIPLVYSDNPAVQARGLIAIRGIALDANLVSRIGVLITNQSSRSAACGVFEEDSSTTFYEQKIKLITDEVRKTYTIPKARVIAPRGFLTYAQVDLVSYLRALSYMKGPLSSLQKSCESEPNQLTRDCLFIARAMRKDESVKNEIVSIIKERKDTVLRIWAVMGMGEIGTKEDIEFLQSVADTDPYFEYANLPLEPNDPKRKFYRVREVARTIIEKINQRTNQAADANETN